MEKKIKDFPNNITDAIKIAENSIKNFQFRGIKNIVISGQGGSGIAGVIAKDIFYKSLSIPIFIVQDYEIPSYVNNETLFVSSSYSGNTEETITSLKSAIKRKSQIICISSGGTIKNLANKNNLYFIELPKGGPPRAMIAYSLIQLIFLFCNIDKSNQIGHTSTELLNISKKLKKDQPEIIERAKEISNSIGKKMPFIYSYSNFEGIALRFKQQLNENSKRHAIFNVIPEMNHNEIVAWSRESLCSIPIFINTSSLEKNKIRMELTSNLIAKNVENHITINYNSKSELEEYFYFLHLFDWISLMIANNDGVDPNDIKLIDKLKNQISN